MLDDLLDALCILDNCQSTGSTRQVGKTTLRAGSPSEPFFDSGHAEEGTWPEAILSIEPFEIAARDVVNAPDRAAARLVRRLYERFGLTEDDIPRELDRATGALRIR